MSEDPKDWEFDDSIPWVPVEHRPPSPKPKNPNRKPRDLNRPGSIPTAYKVRFADDGTKWHSIIDILRPDSPPVEWPEYPDKPLEDDFPPGFSWDQVSDWDLDDPEYVMKKMGIPESERFKIRKRKRPEMPKDLQEFERELYEERELPCAPGIAPQLVDDDNLLADDAIETPQLFPHSGYGGGVTDKLEGGDNYAADGEGGCGGGSEPPQGGGGQEVAAPFDEDSEDISSDAYNMDRSKMWRELQKL